jgi:hypothetical protein
MSITNTFKDIRDTVFTNPSERDSFFLKNVHVVTNVSFTTIASFNIKILGYNNNKKKKKKKIRIIRLIIRNNHEKAHMSSICNKIYLHGRVCV